MIAGFTNCDPDIADPINEETARRVNVTIVYPASTLGMKCRVKLFIVLSAMHTISTAARVTRTMAQVPT